MFLELHRFHFRLKQNSYCILHRSTGTDPLGDHSATFQLRSRRSDLVRSMVVWWSGKLVVVPCGELNETFYDSLWTSWEEETEVDFDFELLGVVAGEGGESHNMRSSAVPAPSQTSSLMRPSPPMRAPVVPGVMSGVNPVGVNPVVRFQSMSRPALGVDGVLRSSEVGRLRFWLGFLQGPCASRMNSISSFSCCNLVIWVWRLRLTSSRWSVSYTIKIKHSVLRSLMHTTRINWL